MKITKKQLPASSVNSPILDTNDQAFDPSKGGPKDPGGLGLELLPHLLCFAFRRIPGREVRGAAVVGHLRSNAATADPGTKDFHGDGLKMVKTHEVHG